MALLNDHIRMVSRNGKIKVVPIWQIKSWINSGLFNPDGGKANLEGIGYAFEDEKSAKADLAAWERAQASRVARSKIDLGPQRADGGIADAHLQARAADNVFDAPPISEPGDEEIESKPRSRQKPQDVI